MACFRACILMLALAAGLLAAPPPPGPPKGPPPPPRRAPLESLDRPAREREALRLRAEIRDLRWRLQREGERDSRREGAWWDLPSRRRQQQRLRRLRMLRQRLEDAQTRLWAIEASLEEPEKPLKDKP